MAGFSIVLLMLLFFWPLVLVYALVSIVAVAAAEFVTSAAFPCMLGSIILSGLAALDVARILWRHFHDREGYPLQRNLFVRPVVLAVVAFALFVAMCVISGTMILEWWHSASSSSSASDTAAAVIALMR